MDNNERLFRSLVSIVTIDGKVDPQEVSFLKNIRKQLNISPEIYSAAISDAKKGERPIFTPQSPEEAEKFLNTLVKAACVDGTVSEPERKLLSTVAKQSSVSLSNLADKLQTALTQYHQGEPTAVPLPLCPKCGYHATSPEDILITGHDGQGECPSCGIIVERYQELQVQKEAKTLLDAAEYSISEFVEATSKEGASEHEFELVSPYLLQVNLKEKAWAKMGSMISYRGGVKFSRERVMEHGVNKMLKKVISGEGAHLMKMNGRGTVFLADHGKKIAILNIEGESITVNGNDLLAMEDQVNWDITMMKRIGGMLAGGLFNITLSGKGLVAITTHYDPITLKVSPGKPIYTDPNATVAWSSALTPEITTDISLKTFLGRGSGESIQLKFSGRGWVVLQPFEEYYAM
ncbi:MAG: AIM24 family protein [Desulfobulbaceae bacterium]|nr:AIM24 family protein [Desulfobulbaceae bacterium]